MLKCFLHNIYKMFSQKVGFCGVGVAFPLSLSPSNFLKDYPLPPPNIDTEVCLPFRGSRFDTIVIERGG